MWCEKGDTYYTVLIRDIIIYKRYNIIYNITYILYQQLIFMVSKDAAAYLFSLFDKRYQYNY